MSINIFVREERMKRIGYLFYLVDPRETLFVNVDQIPAYITEAIPYFVGLILIEQIIAFITNKNLLKVNDAITSAGQGLLMEQSKYVSNFFFYSSIYFAVSLLGSLYQVSQLYITSTSMITFELLTFLQIHS